MSDVLLGQTRGPARLADRRASPGHAGNATQVCATVRHECDIGALGPRAIRRLGHSMCPIVEFIARHPGMVDRLLAVHVDDGTGRCRVCSAGAQTGRQTWPCQLYDYATRAGEVERHRADDRRRST